jgi:hypothetical protein
MPMKVHEAINSLQLDWYRDVLFGRWKWQFVAFSMREG